MQGTALDALRLPGLVKVILGGHTHTFLDATVRVPQARAGPAIPGAFADMG